jgi:hypothetical protein
MTSLGDEALAQIERQAPSRSSDLTSLYQIFRNDNLEAEVWGAQVLDLSYFGSEQERYRRPGGPDSNMQVLGSADHGYCPGDGKNLFTVSVQDDRVRPDGRVELLVIGARGPRQINARWLTKKVLPGDRDLITTERLTVRGHRAFVHAPNKPSTYRLAIETLKPVRMMIAIHWKLKVA